MYFSSDLEEKVYIELPLGVTSSHPNQVSKLLKSIYGLQQSNWQ